MVSVIAALLVSGHLGALHPVEQMLTLLLAFGPFVLLGAVIVVRRRQDAALDTAEDPALDARQDEAGQVAPGREQRETQRER